MPKLKITVLCRFKKLNSELMEIFTLLFNIIKIQPEKIYFNQVYIDMYFRNVLNKVILI